MYFNATIIHINDIQILQLFSMTVVLTLLINEASRNI